VGKAKRYTFEVVVEGKPSPECLARALQIVAQNQKHNPQSEKDVKPAG
jgi:hypothetical protein